MAAMICSDGWIAGEKPGDGEIRAIGDGRYEIRIVRLIPRPVDPARAAPWSLEREKERTEREAAEHVSRYRARLPRAAAEVPGTH